MFVVLLMTYCKPTNPEPRHEANGLSLLRAQPTGGEVVSETTLIEPQTVLDVPAEVAKCPYCGAELIASFSCWTQQDDGSWIASGVDVECKTEPAIVFGTPKAKASQRDWDEWMAQHTYMPYVYWLPVTNRVETWVNAQYRFNMKGEEKQ